MDELSLKEKESKLTKEELHERDNLRREYVTDAIKMLHIPDKDSHNIK